MHPQRLKLLLLTVFCLLVSSSIGSHSARIRHPNRVALATQGKVERMTKWILMSSHMNSSSYVTLFLLSFDAPIPHDLCVQAGAQCLFAPHTTWTQGRNQLLRAMHSYEEQETRLFKYYAFADDDMVDASCNANLECESAEDETACCFDSITYFLLSR